MGAVYAASARATLHSAKPEAYRMKHPSHRRLRLGVLALALVALVAACGGGGGTQNAVSAPNTSPQSVDTGTVTLSWTAVSQNTNGAALTDLAGYRVYYGTSPNALSSLAVLPDPSATSYQATNLSSGTWYFAVAAYTTDGTEGVLSNIVSMTVE
jgi:hypothetical protein